ncbi:hypothetical protein GCM10010965_14370 [Caldalkalibacillus thermarum]|uniref:hypothetical protein n=1 Tax=Caldalkalibacillus thermarum TaxID=296745 RepID=UPI0016663B38|nr:hypothetical protein [Caldalkalibacillus thermarum]GGK22587.1 hypothetical protein GCM10010965_14370 [Caldalkalibacillus thermarum]
MRANFEKGEKGFVTFVDEVGRKKSLFFHNGAFSVVEEVSVERAKEILDHITTGRYRWLKYGQKRKAGVVR